MKLTFFSLAAPTVITVATGVAAKLGLLFKDSSVLENAHKVTSIVFDKTGTLTMGKTVVTDCVILNPERWSEKEFVLYMASGEQGFNKHVLGQSIIDYNNQKFNQELQMPSNFVSVIGRGLQCTVGKYSVIIGNVAWIKENNIQISDENARKISTMEDTQTLVYGAIDGELCGIFGLKDTIKPEAAGVIHKLQHQMKIKVWMVTGDNVRTGMTLGIVLLN
jgi:P-type Cu+ transporter